MRRICRIPRLWRIRRGHVGHCRIPSKLRADEARKERSLKKTDERKTLAEDVEWKKKTNTTSSRHRPKNLIWRESLSCIFVHPIRKWNMILQHDDVRRCILLSRNKIWKIFRIKRIKREKCFYKFYSLLKTMQRVRKYASSLLNKLRSPIASESIHEHLQNRRCSRQCSGFAACDTAIALELPCAMLNKWRILQQGCGSIVKDQTLLSKQN